MSPMGNVVTFRAVMARFFGGAFPLFFQELEGVKGDCEAPWHSCLRRHAAVEGIGLVVKTLL